MGKIPSCDKDGPTKKGPWTPEEDQKLIDYIKQYGHGRWRTLPKYAGLKRCGKSCRLRWTNYLRPDIKRGKFSFEEEEIIIQLHSVLGNKWSTIASRLPGRTDNEIKNYWNTHIRKRLLKMGIDPITHTPRLDLLQLSSLLSSALSRNSSSPLINHIPNYILGDQNLLNLATTFLSYEPKSRTSDSTITPPPPLGFVPQENLVPLDHQHPDHISQNQFQSFLHNNQFQNCTTSTTTSNSTHVVPCANETQLMQRKLEQLSQTLMSSFSSNRPNSTSLANTWENNAQGDQALINQSENYILGNNGYYHDSTHYSPFFNSSSEKLAHVSCNNPNNIANMSFSSLLSTPSSSPYANYSGSSTTTTTTREDEKDGFCSNMFMYDVANFAL